MDLNTKQNNIQFHDNLYYEQDNAPVVNKKKWHYRLICLLVTFLICLMIAGLFVL